MNQATSTLAAKFRALLAECVGPIAFARILLLNTEEQDTNICHSHDFCDPNQIILDAWEVVVSRPVYLPGDVEEGLCTEAEQDADFALMGAAWTAANLSLLTPTTYSPQRKPPR